ncbi:Prefoldin subunit 3 [Phytophthora boehmeriae]|uniref:Prefoldin subunit 3 n=1 Tax=Phytophthora boehmeriae TaxID=109152 RepID=A0A8T1WX22_9STRA|nr:Prefoldin subunit 3 [Phytophthora boehmeriae]
MDARHQKNLEERKKEEERVHRAKVLEYQQIYAESRKAFKEEQQRILLEKMDRDNQRDHDAEVEQHEREAAKLDAKLQQNDEGIRGTVVGDGKTLLWDLIQVSDQPTSRIYRFQDALSQVLDVAQFADKILTAVVAGAVSSMHLASCEDVDTDKSVFTFTAAAFFNLRNGKGKRAIEVATLSSLIEELEQYDRLWIDEAKLLRDKDAVPIDHKARKHVMVGSGH